MTDEQLCSLLKQPEHREQAFTEIYRRYSHRVYVYCRKILFHTQDAEDAFQETFLRFLRGCESAEAVTNLPAYLLTIARNQCMNILLSRTSHAVFEESFHHAIPDHSVESNEINQLLTMALELLPHHWREAVVMQLYSNMSYNEIAQALDVPVTTVRNWVCRGKQQLRTILQPYFAEPPLDRTQQQQ